MLRSSMRRVTFGVVAAGAVVIASTAAVAGQDDGGRHVVRAALPAGAIEHVIVIDLENENFADTFGAASPATYLNGELLRRGELIPNYFATSHVSMGNYTSQISGQATNPSLNNDCLDLTTLAKPPVKGRYNDIAPGTDAADGQVNGDGCVFPSPTATTHGARTIGDQLDATSDDDRHDDGGPEDREGMTWRMYAEDMGNDPARDGGTPDPLGGTDCAHPAIGGADSTNSAAANDQYATRHNGFMYFHSVIDDPARCAAHVVPLGTLTVGTDGAHDAFTGHLARDLKHADTTPAFSFISPNLCNDGHDDPCVDGRPGGLVAADKWLRVWVPKILRSPAFRQDGMLVITFDEAEDDSRACCGSPAPPNVDRAGITGPGGGRVGALVLSPLVRPGSTSRVPYNHYSLLCSLEDAFGLVHLGYAAQPGLACFGSDVYGSAQPVSLIRPDG